VSLPGETVTKSDGFEFNPNGVRDGDYGARFEHKRRQHRAEFVDSGRVIAIQHHISTPITHSNDEQLDLEIGGGLPLGENFQNALLGILVLDG
jgi:hypothetical protein